MTFAFAHRGDSANYDENTIEALQSAFGLGANAFEIDVQKTSDDVLILMHDTTVNRTTDGTGSVSSLTWDYISGLQTTPSGYGVPRLQDVFDAFYGLSVYIFIEIKGVADIAADIRTLADNYPLIDRQLMFMSFYLSIANSCKTQFPDSNVGAAYGFSQFNNTLAVNVANGLDIWPVEYSIMTAQDIADTHADGLELYGFTPATQGLAETAFNAGFDGIGMNDTADLIAAVAATGVTLEYPDVNWRQASLRTATGEIPVSNFNTHTVKYYENGAWGTLAIS